MRVLRSLPKKSLEPSIRRRMYCASRVEAATAARKGAKRRGKEKTPEIDMEDKDKDSEINLMYLI
jgi:hypothetical protein